jgi:PHD/YefM family antitoxin component YafN of YafNO toxin-antitoxin module
MHAVKVEVSNEELRTVRDAMRELNRMVESLESGELSKVVLTQRNQMRAVVVSVETFSAMQRALPGSAGELAAA